MLPLLPMLLRLPLLGLRFEGSSLSPLSGFLAWTLSNSTIHVDNHSASSSLSSSPIGGDLLRSTFVRLMKSIVLLIRSAERFDGNAAIFRLASSAHSWISSIRSARVSQNCPSETARPIAKSVISVPAFAGASAVAASPANATVVAALTVALASSCSASNLFVASASCHCVIAPRRSDRLA